MIKLICKEVKLKKSVEKNMGTTEQEKRATTTEIVNVMVQAWFFFIHNFLSHHDFVLS